MLYLGILSVQGFIALILTCDSLFSQPNFREKELKKCLNSSHIFSATEDCFKSRHRK